MPEKMPGGEPQKPSPEVAELNRRWEDFMKVSERMRENSAVIQSYASLSFLAEDVGKMTGEKFDLSAWESHPDIVAYKALKPLEQAFLKRAEELGQRLYYGLAF
jgi:hypothetical protein